MAGERQGPTVVIIAGQGHEPTQPQVPWSDSGHFLSDSSQNNWQRILALVEPRKSPRMGVCLAKTSMRALSAVGIGFADKGSPSFIVAGETTSVALLFVA